jgi:hypothetical protein
LPTTVTDVQDFVQDLLDNPPDFDSPEHAIEFFTSNAIIACLMQLKEWLENAYTREHLLSGDQLDHILCTSVGYSGIDLLRAGEVTISSQPISEAHRVLPNVKRPFLVTDTSNSGPLDPVGFIYKVMQNYVEVGPSIPWESVMPSFSPLVTTGFKPTDYYKST